MGSLHMNSRGYIEEKKPPRIYGILGIDRLDADDNILNRTNLNAKVENYNNKEYISETSLLNDEKWFKSVLNAKEKEFR